jgi:Holliday junction resolvasome RuvABC DNA-binding subunit
MIALVTGVVAVRRGDHVIVDCGGVGYRLSVSSETLRHIPAIGNRVTLHTHLIPRDDALLLYGFAGEEERDLFLMLLGVQSGSQGRWQTHSGADHRRTAREGRRQPAGARDQRHPLE